MLKFIRKVFRWLLRADLGQIEITVLRIFALLYLTFSLTRVLKDKAADVFGHPDHSPPNIENTTKHLRGSK
jgi:hypothetical protein